MLMPFSNEMVLILAMLGVMSWTVILMRRDHAERDRCEAQLRKSEAQARATIESMLHAVVTLDAAGVIIEANGAAAQLFDYERRELIGRGLDEFVVEKDGNSSLLAHLKSRPGDFKEGGREVRARRKDGSVLPARGAIGAHGEGEERLYTVTIRDLARASEIGLLRGSESQLRQITDVMPTLIAYVDLEQRFRFHNKAYEDTFGLKPEQVHGLTLLEVFGEEIYAAIRPKVAQALSGQSVRFERIQADLQGRLRNYLVSYFPRYTVDGAEGERRVIGFYSTMTDITEMKRIDRMKSEFVSMVSHELRTPLTSIRGSLGLIAGGVAGNMPDAAKNLVDIAKNNCERLIRLINNILDTEKIEAGEMRFDLEVVALAPIVIQAIAANEGFAATWNVTLKLRSGAAEAARVKVDSDGLSQVLTNLLSNAVKYSSPGSSVDVSVARMQGRVRVEVRDHGPGIPEEFRARIFQKFAQADSSDSRQKGGTGLGLNISKAIIERLGGTIGFLTATGAGTTFFFELPEWQEAPPSVFAATRQAKRPCILVCEDDPDIARLIGMMLDRAGYDTDLAFTAARARELAVASPYAAMTVDLKLPDQDGIALMRLLREDERTRRLPIVVVSAMSDAGRIQLNSETLTVSDWLGKPIDANRLVIAIRDAVAGRAKDRPRILHVEDDPDIQHISAAIARDFATFEFAASLKEARERLRLGRYDLILLDLNLPEGEGTGWDLLAAVDALQPPPPVVVFSARDVSRADSQRVAAVLLKADTSNEELLDTIQRVLDRDPSAAAPSPKGASLAQAA
jgi:PAS domain S-box-containing protein